MKILFIQNFYSDNASGGAELLCRDIMKGLINRGHQVTMLTSAPESSSTEFDLRTNLQHVPVVREEKLLQTFRAKINWLMVSRTNYFVTRRIIKQLRPDVIYLHNLEWVTTSPLLAAVDSGKRVIVQAHNHQYAETWKHLNNKDENIVSCIFKLRPKMDGIQVIAISGHIASEFLEQGFPKERVHVIYNGLPGELLKQVSVKDCRILKAVYVGALSPHKGVHIAIEAIRILKKKGTILPLEIIGKPSNQIYFAELKELVSRLKIEQEITFSGPLRREEVFEKLKTVEMLLFPSLWEEAFGLVAAEAMASGAIVIGSNRGAIPEVVGEAGFTVEPNGEAFAETIQKVLSLSRDEKEKLHSVGRQRVKELFSLEKNILKIENVLTATV
jgi:glycosyltransferase involved in cell wall biosynthesis